MRLSRDDGDKSESSSITNQRLMLERYVRENEGFIIIDEYVDDGWSGINFDRPEFKRMINDVEEGKINTIITKDLSRLGRERLNVGYYTEIYFTEKNVRYIALLDNIDTYRDKGMNEMAPFKEVFNDMYVRDISKKMKSAIREKKMSGKFLGATAPYGYMKDPQNKYQLIINEEEAEIVRKVFKLYLEGKGLTKIAQILTNENIEVPGVKRKIRENDKTRLYYTWKQTTISRMLRNPVYIGNLEQFKRVSMSYKIKKRVSVPKEERYICENTHEPIISKEDFEKVQVILSKNKSFKETKHDYLFKGLLYCKECGARLLLSYSHYTYKTKGIYNYTTMCYSYSKLYNNVCTRHSNRLEVLEEILLEHIRNVCNQYLKKDLKEKLVLLGNKNNLIPEENKSNENSLSKLENQIEEIKKCILELYKDKTKGIITDKEFIYMKENFEAERISLLKQKEDLEKSIYNKKEIEINNQKIKELANEFIALKEPTKELINQLVKRVEIAEDGTIDLYFNFQELNMSDCQKDIKNKNAKVTQKTS